MKDGHHRNFCAWVLLVAAACLALGQNCAGPPPSNVPVATACGLHAAHCVEVAGKSPIALAGGDFNGDGHSDVAAANFGTDNVELFFNDGAGALLPGGRYKVGDSPGAIVAADFNADGRLDLAASDGLGIAILINGGDGTFASAVHVVLDKSINAFPVSITAADLDGDGDVDLAASAIGWTIDFQTFISENIDNVGVLLNDGAGAFSLAETVRFDHPHPRLWDITAGDVDGDGRTDIVVDQSTGLVNFLLNRGGGSFENAFSITLGEEHDLSDVRLVDLDGDGKLDLVVADNGDPLDLDDAGGGVAIFRNRGGGRFEQIVFVVGGDTPTSIAVGDYDADGRPDVAIAHNRSDDVMILFNQGPNTFAATQRFPVGDGPTSVMAADFNGDGRLDLAVAHMISGAVGLHFNDGTGCFTCNR